MLRFVCVFCAGAAFAYGVLAAQWLDWTSALGLWAGAAFFLIAAAMATAPKAETVRLPPLRLVGREGKR